MSGRKIQLESFEAGFERLGLRFFQAREFLVMGSGNAGGRCGGKNTPPPRKVWPDIYRVAAVWDLVRARLGSPITTLSVYRSPAYNSCIGGASLSQHMLGKAADATGGKVPARELYDIALELRAEGVFSGGVGLYTNSNFVHIDVRGVDATW